MKMIFLITLLFSFNLFAARIIGLDVRSHGELVENPAPGAIHIPMSKLDSQAQSKLDKNLDIYVFCEGGVRAEKAKNILLKKGFKNVVNINSWRQWNQLKKIK